MFFYIAYTLIPNLYIFYIHIFLQYWLIIDILSISINNNNIFNQNLIFKKKKINYDYDDEIMYSII